MEDKQLMNYMKLKVIIIEAAVILRNLFYQQWEIIYGEKWDSVKNPGKVLISDIGRELYQNGKLAEKNALAEGDINKLDITILQKLHLAMKNKISIDKEIMKQIRVIVEVRNRLAHHPNIVSKQEFEDYWEKLSKALVFLGFSEVKLKDLYSSTNIGGITVSNARVC